MASKHLKIIEKLGPNRVKQNEPLAKETTFRIGGPADLFYEAKTSDELIAAVKAARQLEVPFFILAGGSKLLVSNEGFRGLVIKIFSSSFSILNSRIRAGAGVPLKQLVVAAADAGLAGLEFAAGIPGTIGGAVVGNAGAWQKNIGSRLKSVYVLQPNNQLVWLNQKDCHFAYRQSRFKTSGEVIIKVELKLRKGNREIIKKRIIKNLIRRQKQPQEPSAGCIFINPKSKSAGELIEESSLKGKRIGNAQISSQHANFIVNLGQAKANEVLQLIKLAQSVVKKKFGVKLEKEIRLLGFDKIERL